MSRVVASWKLRASNLAALMVVSLGLAAISVTARADEPGGSIRWKAASLPAPFLTNEGTVDRVLEASAVEIIGGGRLVLVGHDKALPLFVVEAATGRSIGQPLSCDRFADLASRGAKWEASARDDQGNYYFVGSRPADAVLPNVTWLVKFRLEGDGSLEHPLAIPSKSIVAWNLTPALTEALKGEGTDPALAPRLSVEGLEVTSIQEGAQVRRRAVLGMRRPDDLLRAFTIDLPDQPSALEPGNIAPARRLFAFRGTGRDRCPEQIRSLLRVPAWRGYLIATATEDEFNAFHGNTLYFLADADMVSNGISTPSRVAVFEVAMKVEGLCMFSRSAEDERLDRIRLFLTYDNDVLKTRIPGRFQTIELERSSGHHDGANPNPAK